MQGNQTVAQVISEFIARRGFWFFFPEKKNKKFPDVLSALPAEKQPNGSIPVNGMIIDLQKRYKTILFRNYRHIICLKIF